VFKNKISDLSLFTTRRLVEQNPDHFIEIRHQVCW